MSAADGNAGAGERRFGHVAIVGRPNVGKSTLLNALVGQKIAAASRRRHTTRNRIVGIVTSGAVQMALVDTPGLEAGAKGLLAKTLARTAAGAVHDVDLVLMLVEAGAWTDDDAAVLARVKESGAPVALGITKIDRLRDRDQLLPFIDELRGRHDFAEIVPVSGLKGINVDHLAASLAAYMPAGEFHFADDQVTDRSERFLAGEIIREQLLEQLGQEIPYATFVEVESFEETGNGTRIAAVVSVERESQKPIVIGRGGHRIKAIGTAAREALGRALDRPVHLYLRVRVREGWREDAKSLRDAGVDGAQ